MRIFTATTGWSGSLYVSEVFRTMTDYPSFHEPMPWCIGKTLEQVNTQNGHGLDAEVAKELDRKVAEVRKCEVEGRYFESNQMFIKVYAERILDEFTNVGCLYLWRNPVEVLLSHHKKCSEQEDDWILQGHWTKNLLRTERPMSFYENVLWQWFEVRERFLKLRRRFRKTYVMDFTRLNDVNEWDRVFAHFGVTRRPGSQLPSLKRNNIEGDAAETMDSMFKVWSRPGKSETKKYKAKMIELEAIDAAKKIIAANSALMNSAVFHD